METVKDAVKLANGYAYSFETSTLFKDGKMRLLSVKQHQILALLLKNIGKVVSFEMIIDNCWNKDNVDFRTISSHIRDIRNKIDDGITIKNVRGQGYIINA